MAAMVAEVAAKKAVLSLFKNVRERGGKRERSGGLERWDRDRVFAK